MATILCISNASDPATALGHQWMKKFAKYAALKGHNVIFQETPTLQILYKALIDYDPDLIVAIGHGGFKALTVGSNILIGTKGYDAATKKNIKNGDEAYFSGRIVLLLTCNAGRELVKALVDNGARAALGFKEPFIFMSDDNLTPDQDESAKPFFVSMLQPALQLVDGATFSQAVQTTREAFKQYIKETSKDKESLRYLKFDLENLVALGDPAARLA